MKQIYGDKYSIAWFNLAEFVARKEKERALGIYRLLVHSLSDPAVISQLEGDLLLSFNDMRAIECYIKAAQLYEKDSRIAQAAAVYEHILLLEDNQIPYLSSIITLYLKLNNETKISTYVHMITTIFMSQQAYQDLELWIESLQLSMSQKQSAQLYAAVFFAFLDQSPNEEYTDHLLRKTLVLLLEQDDAKYFRQFLTKLETISKFYHAKAVQFIEN